MYLTIIQTTNELLMNLSRERRIAGITVYSGIHLTGIEATTGGSLRSGSLKDTAKAIKNR